MGYEQRNLKVFLSSSMVEFADERQAIQKELTRFDIPHFVFEIEGASGKSPQVLFKQAVTHATVYVGVFGKIFGKYTQEEYVQARNEKITCLLYFQKCDEVERSLELQQFLKDLNEVVDVPSRYHFSTSDELTSQILKDLIRWLDERPQVNSEPEGHKIDIRDNLPVLCDRQDQHDDLRKQVLNYFKQEPRRPLLLLLPGTWHEGHRHFLTRVEWHSLPKVLSIVPAEARARKEEYMLKAVELDGEIQPHHSTEDIREKVAYGLSQAMDEEDAFVSHYIDDEQLDALIIKAVVSEKLCKGDFQSPLHTIMSYVAGVRGIPRHVLFVCVVCLMDEPCRETRWEFMKRLSTVMGLTGQPPELASERASQEFQRNMPNDASVQVYALPRLDSIQVYHGHNWRGLEEVTTWVKKYRPNSPIRDQDIQTIFGERPSLPMNLLYDQLLALLVEERDSRRT